MARSIESRFIAGPEGVKDEKAHLINRIKDFENQCGYKFNPDQEDYWSLMKDKLKEFSKEDMDYLFVQHHFLGENEEKIIDTVQSILDERRKEQIKKIKNQKTAPPKGADDLRDVAKEAFKDTGFKNIY